MIANDEVCVTCRAGLHSQCSEQPESLELYCCCGETYTLIGHLREMVGDDSEGETRTRPTKGGVSFTADVEFIAPKMVGNSGYIHPDAWASTSNIGELTDPKSTGRKRVARMYPIEPGMACEWARMKDNGGGPYPVIGCMGSPASDLHHGPDKNTLNNSKMSVGIGFGENVHRICSDCHNSWHAANDPHYPEYDRVEKQAEPWLPMIEGAWGPQVASPAEFDELVAEEQRREKRRKDRGRDTRGRNSKPRTGPDASVADDGE